MDFGRKTNELYGRDIVIWLAIISGVAFITFALKAGRLTDTAAGIVYLTIVVWIASRVGFALSLFVALVSAVAFDYYFLPPIGTLRLAGVPEWIGMICFVGSSIVVGRLSEQTRRQGRQAQQRSRDAERLYTLSQEMMLLEDAAQLIRELPLLIERNFALDSVVLYVRDQDQFYATISEVPASLQASLRSLTQGHSATMAGPLDYSMLALMLGLRPIGALAWNPDRISREVAAAISAQVAIALTRALAIETYTRMEAVREGDRLRTALIDSLTHELRTPLTSIRAAATTLVHGEGLDEATRKDLTALVDEESARLDKLIGEAVEMAEIDADVLKIHPVPQLSRTFLEQALEESRGALQRHHTVTLVEEPDTPAWFDSHLLGRVLRHLLENAGRYTPAGTRITLRGRRADGRLEFSVEDNGPGIDPADLPLVFEKFYRGKNAGAAGKGTGMGLAIARSIVQAHGGGMEVASTPGQGATLRFWVPLMENEPGDAPSRLSSSFDSK